MAAHEDTRLVNEERLDLSLIAPRNRTLVIQCGQPRAPREFQIRGRLDTDRMIEFLQLETRINEALADKTDNAGAMLIEALDDGNESIRDLLRELNEDVPAKLHLDEQQILMTLSWISGDVSVAEAIARALTGGVSGAKTEEELVAAAADGGAGGAAADADAPFSSSNSS